MTDITQPSKKRKPIGKKLRFEVFKRDGFICGYCGAHPPAVILQIDHIIPVNGGGDNSINNLITACGGCNQGKSARLLTDIPQSLADRAKEIKERERQLSGYREIIIKRDERIEQDINRIDYIFESLNPGYCLSESGRRSVGRFLKKLEPEEIIEALDVTYGDIEREDAFRYFCGICWKKIKEMECTDG